MIITVEHFINKLYEFPLEREVTIRVTFPDDPGMNLAMQTGALECGIGLTSGEDENGSPVAVFLVEITNQKKE